MIIYEISIPARTAVPVQERTPERKELNGKDPTIAMKITCAQNRKPNAIMLTMTILAHTEESHTIAYAYIS